MTKQCVPPFTAFYFLAFTSRHCTLSTPNLTEHIYGLMLAC
jgi:hypothetical protein